MQLLEATGAGPPADVDRTADNPAPLRTHSHADGESRRCAARAATLVRQLLENVAKPWSVLVFNSASDACQFDGDEFRVTATPIGEPLSQADASFDAVIALDVFDHIASDRRKQFVGDCLRIARHGVVFGQPDGRPEVEQIERLMITLYARRFGRPHPVFSHRGRHANPTVGDLAAILNELDCAFGIVNDLPLDVWAARRMHEDCLPDRPFSESTSTTELPPYRRFVICARSFDTISALSAIADTQVAHLGEASINDVDAANLVIRLAGDIMATLDADLRIERLAREAEHDELRQSAWHWQEKALAFGSFAASARKSLGWKLGAPMRALRRWLRPRGFDSSALLPWRFVEPIRRGPPNAWRVTESGGQFVVPCYLPAGWVRVRLRLRRTGTTKPQREQAEIVFHGGDWAGEPIWQEQFAWTESLSDQLYVDLPEPAFGVRVQPLRGEGSFAVETFSVEPLAPLAAFASAVASKLKLLRDYRCTGRSIGRAAMLLLRGRFGELRAKTFRGLADLRQMKVEDDRAEEVNAAWRRRSLSDQDRQRFDAELRALAAAPPLTLVLTVPGMPESTVRLAIESVKRQVFPHWQLIVATTEATLPATRRLLKHFAEDARVTVLPPTTGEKAARAAACSAIRTEYAVVLPHGFELVEEALLRLAQRINASPIPKLLVSAATNSVGPMLSAKLCLARAADLKSGSTDESFTDIGCLPEQLTRPAACLQTVRLVENDAEPQPTVVGPEWIVTGNLVGISGYDYVVFEIFRGLIGLNRNVHFNGGCSVRPELLLPKMAARVRPKRSTDRELIIAPPFAVQRYGPTKSSVVFSMWESDRLQPNWVNSLNRAGLVIVPSRWGAECFRASGVTTPIEVVPLGCDPLVFHPREEAPEICTFGTAAALVAGGVRKNTALLIDWFEKAFPNEDDVRLRVKVTPKCDLPDSEDPRIEIERQFLPPPRLAEWYRSLTAFVSISHAEGFGLHLLEAMACGRPVISPHYSGVTEYFDATVGYPIEHSLVPAECGVYSGRWAEPSEASTIETMREIYRNLNDADCRGDRAAARARRFTWKDTGRRLVQLLDQFVERDR